MVLKKSNNKRSQLIDTALPLFYQHGIHAIGINEILAKSGIAKKTLYNYFDSKEALIQACALERDQRFMQWLTSRCPEASSTNVFIEQLFDSLDDWINNRDTVLGNFGGCFFVNTAAEYGNAESDIYKLCLQHKLNIKQFIEQRLAFNIKGSTTIASLTDLLLQLKEGVINCAYVMGDKDAALKAKVLALSFITTSL